jgi:hypothetical protein
MASDRQAAARARRQEVTAKIDAALDKALDGTWRTAEALVSRMKGDHPELRRHLDAQRVGARLSGRARRGEAEKRDSPGGYDHEWRKP